MHLTNYAINKNSDKFVFNNDENNFDTGHKRSYSYVLRYLASQGIDTKKLQDKIHAIFIKTLCSAQPILAHNYRSCQPENHPNNMCFEVLGMDILLDANLKPYLLEVNHTPSFTTDTPLDKNIKKGLIRDAMLLLNISGKNKVRIRNQMKMDFQKRVVEGKKEKVTPE
jgi:tubulin polyglutamylase TTLL6/13